jgi:predicted pyridoxine 5'-phosphate oxidase superfamily flavin-nucleotide-binding protein
MRLDRDIISFFENQGCVVFSTVDDKGYPHSSCKGIVKIDETGEALILDAYYGRTYLNLQNNQLASITAFNEHKFKGYCLKGKARLVKEKEVGADVIRVWDKRISGRLAQRILKNIREGKVDKKHPEARLPKPKHMILFKVNEIVDLTPGSLKF